jgi:hypothetical protein
MAGIRRHKRHEETGWFTRAAIHSLTGLAFGTIVALVLVVFSHTSPMIQLARRGSDFGMRLYAHWQVELGGGPVGRDVTAFAFLDVNPEACYRFVDAAYRSQCDHPTTPPAHFLMRIVSTALRANPKVLILDFPLDGSPGLGTALENVTRSDGACRTVTILGRDGGPAKAPSPQRSLPCRDAVRGTCGGAGRPLHEDRGLHLLCPGDAGGLQHRQRGACR